MKSKIPLFFISTSLFLLFFSICHVYGEKQKTEPDKALCNRMIRFGIQAHERKKYLDAKEYFRQAIHADSTSNTAWKHYDLAVIFALAEKVEKNQHLIKPSAALTGDAEKNSVSPFVNTKTLSKEQLGIFDEDAGDAGDADTTAEADDGCY